MRIRVNVLFMFLVVLTVGYRGWYGPKKDTVKKKKTIGNRCSRQNSTFKRQ